ncbi:hypothetical protein KP509_21G054200 [Ceratopteris richardii]|uniref:Pentatricopeptide repeat-containing protein n=1 Tax=Ceratopteris richardii TaxID=49495 RepID=A0A8T2SBI4_CERRI|nr:hypothetical protein KP509_21G054200 [Ceratopteris richardii]
MMEGEAIFPNAVTYVCIIRACGNIVSLGKGCETHTEVSRKGFLKENVLVGSALVDMYAKCGLLNRAKEVLDNLPIRNVCSWTPLILGYADHGYCEKAFECYEHIQSEGGLSPNAVTYVCALKACGSLRATDKGEHIHHEVNQQGLLRSNVKLGTALVGMYAKCGAFTKARQVLNELAIRDTISWNALISGYAEHNEGNEALVCFDQMQDEGLVPDSVTYASVIKACGSIGALQKGQKIYDGISKKSPSQNDIFISNSLIEMYARGNNLKKALEVLESLPVRNALSWNVLIAGYVEHGKDEQAWECFEQMHCEDILPTPATFHLILKVCGRMEASDRGKRVHDEIVKQGLLRNNHKLCTAVVSMYAKCGAFVKAQEIFNELPVLDVFSWNALIGGYIDHQKSEQALKCYEQMQQQGLSPDVVTFNCILRACGDLQTIDKGEMLHSEISKRRLLENNLMLGTALVDMYAKCGALAKAHQLLEELPIRDVVIWNSLIAGYADAGDGIKALDCYEQMLEEGIVPDAGTFPCILKVCGTMRAAEKGEQIHCKIAELGLLGNDVVMGSALVYMYAMCDDLGKAQRTLMELLERDVVCWNALIVGCVEHGKCDQALTFFEQMQDEGIPPDAVSYSCVLKACGILGATIRGQAIHDEIARRGLLGNDIVLGNVLVDMYAKCGVLEKARKILDELPRRNLISWNTLITGYVEHGKSEQALCCLDKMQFEGLSPDIVTYTSLLKACGDMRSITKGEKIHNEIAKVSSFQCNIVVGTALIDMYAKCGAFSKAQKVFEELSIRNAISYNALITGYVEHDEAEEALKCFEKMQLDGISPDAVTYACILEGCGDIIAVGMGEKLYEQISEQGLLAKNIRLGTSLLHMYVKCGSFVKAWQVLNELPSQDVVCWNALIDGFNKHGECLQALQCYEQMQQHGLSPNAFTFSSVLSACSRLNLVMQAEQHFADMSKYGIPPEMEHLTCMVDVFGRAGLLDKAVQIIQRMSSSSFDNGTLYALLNNCLKWGDIKTARWALEHTAAEEKVEVAFYNVMKDIYRSAEMQKDADNIEAMKILQEHKISHAFDW